MKKIKQYSLVKFDYDNIKKEFHEYYKDVFKYNAHYIFLGDIPNMEDHCIVIGVENKNIEIGYHTENFIELTEDEV